MKKNIFILLAGILALSCIITACTSESGKYKNGVYEGKSSLTSESYYGKAKLTVKNGKINEVFFEIYDANLIDPSKVTKDDEDSGDTVMDEAYGEKMFADIPVYQEQVRSELKGMKQYKQQLIDGQEVEKVDIMSGATWSYNIFKETMEKTLEKAAK